MYLICRYLVPKPTQSHRLVRAIDIYDNNNNNNNNNNMWLTAPREPRRSTRLLQPTGGWQYELGIFL